MAGTNLKMLSQTRSGTPRKTQLRGCRTMRNFTMPPLGVPRDRVRVKPLAMILGILTSIETPAFFVKSFEQVIRLHENRVPWGRASF